MKLECFKVSPHAPPLVPGVGRRAWMDETTNRFAYRCLPLTMANSSGWELRCPADVTIKWDGKTDKKSIRISGYDPKFPVRAFVQSHFGEGVVTFLTGYLFRTPPGVAVWASGAPNQPKDGIYPLTGLIETDWLPFPFTMNWQMTRPGEVRFEKDEPFCFITLIDHGGIEAVSPETRSIDEEPALKAEYEAWSRSRAEFNKAIEASDDESMKSVWQRFYVKGEAPGGARADKATHRSKRRLQGPTDKSS